MKESHSDFSIVKGYLELKNKYNLETKNFKETIQLMEEKFKKHLADLENEVRKRNEHIKVLDTKIQDLTQNVAEKDEQLKNLGLQLHKLKLESTEKVQKQTDGGDLSRKTKFGLFK